MNRLLSGLLAAGLLALAGCKERIAPHVTPEPDPEFLVAEALTADSGGRGTPEPGHPAPSKTITLTVNNAPGPEQTVDHDILQQTVDLFQKRHPNIKIQFSPWKFTPESFLDRAQSRALTDIVEVDCSQIPPILDMNLAADLTELAASAPQLAEVNPELMAHLTRNGRIYGLPGEMHTMALFYNRSLVDAALEGKKPEKKTDKKSEQKKDEKKGKNAKNGKQAPDESSESPASSGEAEPSGETPEESSGETPEPSGETEESSGETGEASGETNENMESAPEEEKPREPLQRRRRNSNDSESSGRRPSQGADEVPRPYLTDEPVFESKPESLLARYGFSIPEAEQLNAPRVLAQYQQPGYYYADPYGQQQQQPQQAPRRGRQAQQPQPYYGQQPGYYQQPAQAPQPQPQPRRRGFMGWWGGRQQPQQVPQEPYQAPPQYDPYDPESGGYRRAPVEQLYNVEPTPTQRRRRSTTDSDGESTRAREKRLAELNKDVLTTDPVELTAETDAQARVTTEIETADLPKDWDSFIRLAVKLTDHSTTPTYGYAPILFAREGGREFSQWAMQAGLQIQIPNGSGTATLDVNTTSAAMVAQFLKDLHWRYDVTPPPADSYADKLIELFAQGRIAMMMLPANEETINRLLRLGFPLEDLGIAPLPGGPANRKHLAFGNCYIVNSQLGQEKRAAALQWLLFQLDPEVVKLRRTMAYREKDWTGVPEVPLFRPEKQQKLTEALKPYYTLPIFPDYMRTVASNVALEPPYFTDRLYEAIAQGVRPIVENRNSDPIQSITYVGSDFEKKYLQSNNQPDGIRRYLQKIPGL